MVKTPKTRHYKPQRAPVTIDLEATADATPAHSADEARREGADSIATELEVAESPAKAGGFEPWLAPDESSSNVAPNKDGDGEQAFDTAEYSVSKRSNDDAQDAKLPGSDPVAQPADIGDSQPAKSSYGRGSATGSTGKGDSSSTQTFAPPPRRGGLSNLTAGLIGGLIALLGAGGLQFAGLLGAPGAYSDTAALASLQGEIGTLKSEVETLKSAGGGDSGAAVAGLTTALDQVKSDVAALQSAVQSGGAGDSAAVGALGAKVQELEAAIGKLSQAGAGASQDDVTALAGKLAAVEQSIATLASKVDAQAAQPKIALAISAAAIKSALDRGSPFTAELETFAAISPNAPEIAALRQHADAGVMTRGDIAKAFPDTANAMVAASAPADQDAGFFQRLLASAESVVKVRPVGEVAGEDPPARVARMEVAINAGDFDKALAEYAALPDAVKAAGMTLVDKIKARLEVEKLVDQMIAGAMKAA